MALPRRSEFKVAWQIFFGFGAAAIAAPISAIQYGTIPLWTLACMICGVIVILRTYAYVRTNATSPQASENLFRFIDKRIERTKLVTVDPGAGHTVHSTIILATCALFALLVTVLVYSAVTCGVSDDIPGNQFLWATLLVIFGASVAVTAPETFRRWSWNSQGITTSVWPWSRTILWCDAVRVGKHKFGYWFIESRQGKRIGWTEYTIRSDALVRAISNARPDLDMTLFSDSLSAPQL